MENKKKTILIADDDDPSFILFSMQMADHFNVIRATNGKEVVALFSKNKELVDLIIMDLSMPIMSGFEATLAIRKLNSEVLIVAHTAFAMESELPKILEAGFNNAIQKPASLEDILKILGMK